MLRARFPDSMSRAGTIRQFVRYLLVGIINTGFSYGLYVLFVYLGFGFAIANLIALILGIIFSFTTQGRFVFNDTRRSNLIRFVLVWVFIYGLNTLLIALFISLGFNAYISGALALPINTVIAFIAQKLFVFKTSTREHV